MNIPPLKFMDAAKYYDQLRCNIPGAQHRIVIHAMGVLWGPQTDQLVPLLVEALRQGVEVRIVGDIYSKFEARIPRINRTQVASWRHTQAINQELRDHGAHITYVGKLRANPYKGRCHSKITIIDDIVYTFGGTNFTDGSFDNHDYMFEVQSAELANDLYKLVQEIEKNAVLASKIQPLGTHNTLLFDGGFAGESVIYKTACELIADARKVYYVSQMCPSGRLAKLIAATENECYFIRPSQAEPPASLDLLVNKWRYGIINRYKQPGYIHAKFILTEGHDGKRHTVSGSHNFSWRGVAYGTKEIALHSTDPAVWDSLYTFMHEDIIGQPAVQR